MAYPITDSVQRRHYDQHLSRGGEPQADVSTDDADYTMALGASGADYAAVNQESRVAYDSADTSASSDTVQHAQSTAHTTATAETAGASTSAYSEADGGTADGKPHSGGSKLLKGLIPLIGLLLLGWLGLKLLGDKTAEEADAAATGDAAATASAAADAATPDAVGGQLTGFFSDATESLNGITDADSATAALPKFEELGGTLDGISGGFENVAEDARGPIADIASKGMESFAPLVDKVLALPGVGDILRPVIEPMLEKLKGMAG